MGDLKPDSATSPNTPEVTSTVSSADHLNLGYTYTQRVRHNSNYSGLLATCFASTNFLLWLLRICYSPGFDTASIPGYRTSRKWLIELPKWRNWQTHMIQGHAPLRVSGFNSRLRHQHLPSIYYQSVAELLRHLFEHRLTPLRVSVWAELSSNCQVSCPNGGPTPEPLR